MWVHLSVKIESEGLPPDFLMLSNHKISAYIIISTTFHMEKWRGESKSKKEICNNIWQKLNII